MTVKDDAQKLRTHIEVGRLDVVTARVRGYNHMGALLTDLVLQQRSNYARVVAPRVVAIQKREGAATVSGVDLILREEGAESLLRHRAKWRGELLHEITEWLSDCGVETVEDLRKRIDDNGGEDATAFRSRFAGIKHVGPKTSRYLEILAGGSAIAIDSRLQEFARLAGIENLNVAHLQQVYEETADSLNADPGNLDAAVWAYMTDGGRGRLIECPHCGKPLPR